MVARWAHNPEVRGSNPLPATWGGRYAIWLSAACNVNGGVAQLVEHGAHNSGVPSSSLGAATWSTVFGSKSTVHSLEISELLRKGSLKYDQSDWNIS